MRDPDSSKDKRIAELERAGTQRKWGELRAQEALKFAESIVETVREPLLVLDANLKVLLANHSFYATFKVTPEDTLRHVVYELGNGEWDIPELRRLLEGIISEKEVINDFEVAHGFKEIGYKIMVLNARRIYRKSMGTQAILLAIEDITERKLAEEALTKSEQLYRSLFENMLNGFAYCQMHFDENGRPCDFTYMSVSSAFEALTGLRNIVGKKASEVIPGDREVEPELLEVYGRVSRTGNSERFEMFIDSLEMWFLVSVYSMQHGYFVAVFDAITSRKQAEGELRGSIKSFRASMETTVQVLSLAVEIRDPYTAGHQRRVTELACAIATDMHLPPDQIEGIRMAGAIHDIGKISIPPEILSKPGNLPPMEYALIQAHAAKGAEILNHITSPWPLSEIVRQHHERMDGSGYPQGLKGEEILIEARILAVADVVEAMASHRPYRPALGVDVALEEVEQNAGVLYDKTVAEVCLRLFREKGFTFETSP